MIAAAVQADITEYRAEFVAAYNCQPIAKGLTSYSQHVANMWTAQKPLCPAMSPSAPAPLIAPLDCTLTTSPVGGFVRAGLGRHRGVVSWS
jgi:hypothetical protein